MGQAAGRRERMAVKETKSRERPVILPGRAADIRKKISGISGGAGRYSGKRA